MKPRPRLSPGRRAFVSITRVLALLIVHSRADEVIGSHHAEIVQRVATGAGVPTETLYIDGLGHNDMPMGDERATSGTVGFFLNVRR